MNSIVYAVAAPRDTMVSKAADAAYAFIAGSGGSTTASSGPTDVYNSVPVHDDGNAGVQYRPIYAATAGADVSLSSSGDVNAAEVQYRPIYAATADAGAGAGGANVGDSSNDGGSSVGTYSTAVPRGNAAHAHPVNREDRPTVAAPSLTVPRAAKRAKCQRPSPKGGTCKNQALAGRNYCASHACPTDMCTESKSSAEATCSHHADSSGSKGISRKSRDGSTYDGFGGSGGAGNVGGYSGSDRNAASGNTGVVRGKQSVYGGFDEDEDEEV